MSMADALSNVVADYTTTELSVTPQNIMTEQADKNQRIYTADDGSITVVSKSSITIFTVTLQWDYLSSTDAATVSDFFFSATKGNGMERTFYWQHPTDTKTYTVRFASPLSRSFRAGVPNYIGIPQVTFRVMGKKA